MDLEEAEILLGQLHRHCEEVGGADESPAVPPDKLAEFNDAMHSLRQFESQLLAEPDIFPHLRFWMVDITGGSNRSATKHMIPGDTRLEDGMPVEDLISIMQNAGGPLMTQVEAWLRLQQYDVPDRGAGLGGWHVGCHCTQEEADRLCRDIRVAFRDHFQAGELRLHRRFWGIKVKR